VRRGQARFVAELLRAGVKVPAPYSAVNRRRRQNNLHPSSEAHGENKRRIASLLTENMVLRFGGGYPGFFVLIFDPRVSIAFYNFFYKAFILYYY